MTEREMQELLWNHPDKLLNEPLAKFRWEPQSQVGRADLVFKDRRDRLLIVEVKRRKLGREAINQLLDYFGMMKREFPNKPVELMVVANSIPEERRLSCDQYNIEWREISEKKFRDVAGEVGYTFESERDAATEAVAGATPRNTERAIPPGRSGKKTSGWSFGATASRGGDPGEFLSRCDEEGRAFFSFLFGRLESEVANRTRVTWNHESGFSLHFYFNRLGFVEMVWGFPARNREGKPGKYGQSLVLPFDFAKKRDVPVRFINAFGDALAAASPLSPAPKRPRIPVNSLTPTETEHILKTICEFAQKASTAA